MEIEKREKLTTMPYDHEFDVVGKDGARRIEMCHATGYECLIDGIWWDEYTDSNGDYRYGNYRIII